MIYYIIDDKYETGLKRFQEAVNEVSEKEKNQYERIVPKGVNTQSDYDFLFEDVDMIIQGIIHGKGYYKYLKTNLDKNIARLIIDIELSKKDKPVKMSEKIVKVMLDKYPNKFLLISGYSHDTLIQPADFFNPDIYERIKHKIIDKRYITSSEDDKHYLLNMLKQIRD